MGNRDARSVNTWRSFTDTVKEQLEQRVEGIPEPFRIEGSTASVLEVASEQGFTLEQYVRKDPVQAMKVAELCLAEWLKIQSQAAVTGTIDTTDGRFTVDRSGVALINDRVRMAEKDRDRVEQYCAVTPVKGERKAEHVSRVLYNRAIQKGDIKSIEYLMNRVDGRPGESHAVAVDYDQEYVDKVMLTLFDRQLDVANSGNGTKLICCSRRAGKTRTLVSLCLIECLKAPNTSCIYIGATQEQTDMIVDTICQQIVDKCHLRNSAGKRFDWKHMDNGSRIIVRGLSNTKDPDQIRGHKAKVVVIDEFFHLPDALLEYLQREVLQPMQMDYADDYKFLCAGTPPSIKGTFGEKAWKEWDCDHFFWTWKENPYPVDIHYREEYITKVLTEKGLTWDSTFARREYLGEWIYDEDLLLYPEFKTYNPEMGIPRWDVDMVLFGIDYGVSDSDALIGIAWDTKGRRGFEFYEEKFSRYDMKDRSISQLQYLSGKIEEAWLKAMDFFPTYTPKEANKRILWVADDNDQHLTGHFNLNCKIEGMEDVRLNIMNAHKTDSVFMQDKIRDLLRTGGLMLIADGKAVDECQKTVVKRGVNGEVFPDVDNKIYHPDLLPAMRYALWNVIGDERL